MTRSQLLQALLPAVHAAGNAILEVYASDFTVRLKEDASPVTLADGRAEALLIAALGKITPDIPIIAEEAYSAGKVPLVGDRFWLVDPLDGTREFISRNGEFTVNVALVEDGRPTVGIVSAPALDRLFTGIEAEGAFVADTAGRREIACRRAPRHRPIVVASRSHGNAVELDKFLAKLGPADLLNAGSSLKFCLIASGDADLYPRFGRTMEWDTAAGDAVLRAAGGTVVDLEGQPLRYGKPSFENPHFIARGT